METPEKKAVAPRIPASDAAPDSSHAEQFVPLGMRVAAAWSWRVVVLLAAAAAVLWLIVQVRIIVIPVLIAVLLTALLAPVVHFFERQQLPRWMGVVSALLLLFAAVGGLLALIVTQLRKGLGDVVERTTAAWAELLHWVEQTFGLQATQIDNLITQTIHTIEKHQSEIWSGALGVATTASQVVTGSLLTLFSLIFLLIDGRRIWLWVLGFLPRSVHAPLDAAGRAGWVSVGQYVRVQVFVAFVDAVGIGIGAALLGVPLPIPIAILVFLGSFIPFLGAITTGALAVFIALAYNGPVNALIMLGVVILVNQIEGHVLQPLVMGSAVRVHPLGVVLAVSTGALLAGVPGALFAVPLAASANSIVNVLAHRQWDPESDPVQKYHAAKEKRLEIFRRAKLVKRQR